jgi:hypothetical protein
MTLAKKSIKKGRDGGKIRAAATSSQPLLSPGAAVAKQESVIILHK